MSEIRNTENEKDVVLFSPAVEVFCPFASSVDASRLNMGNKQMGQLVISKKTETPFIIDKNYKDLSTVQSPYQEIAEDDGIVIFRKDELLIIYYTTQKNMELKHIPMYKKLINNSLSLKYCVTEGMSFKKGDVLFDYSNYIPETQLPRVGYRADILFSTFFGFNADDAIAISESFSKKTEIEYSEKIFIPITKFMKFIKNKKSGSYFPLINEVLKDTDKIAKYYNIDMEDFFLTELINIDESTESKYYTKGIEGIKNGKIDRIKVHKLTDKSFDEKRKEYFYTSELITELEYYYNIQQKDIESLRLKFLSLGLKESDVEEYVENIESQYFQMKNPSKALIEEFGMRYNTDPEFLDYIVEIDISYTTGTTKGDKFSNLYAGKGTVALIVPDELMPKNPETGKPFDVVFNSLGIFGRNNWGSIYELNLSKIIRDIEKSDNALRIKKLRLVAELFLKDTDPEYYNTVMNLLSSNETISPVLDDIDKNGLYLFFSNFANIPYHEFMKKINKYEATFEVDLTSKKEITFTSSFITYLRAFLNLENTIFRKNDIKSYYNTKAKLQYGENYLIKLYHTSNSKYNAVSFANNYSKTTGQPAKGRKVEGGQHLSWQSTASLLSHHHNNAVLKELYTFKSDSQEDKETFLMKIIKDGKYNMKKKYQSVTKKTINTALKIIGMEFT